MNPQEISNRKFSKSAAGYRPEEVEEYLRDVAIAYAKEIKEKEENELKIVKLVEKINEYRSDEDAIRDALLVAQKQGNRIIAEAKAEAEKIVAEAQQKRDSLLADIQSDCDTLKRTEIEKVASAIRAENEKLAAVEAASKTQRELQGEKLRELQKEVTDFKKKLILVLDEQVKLAASLPELSEEQIEEILNTEPVFAPVPEPVTEIPTAPIEVPKEEPVAEKKETKNSNDNNAFSFAGFKRQNYSAEELKFGQNNHN